MYPIPPNETLIETKTCRHCQASFPITDKDLEFYEKVSPVFPRPPLEGGMSEGQGGSVSETMNPQSATKQADSSLTKGALKKYLIPPPTLCPDCRQQRRLSFRNERKLYKRKCDATNKDIISVYSPDKPYKVYHQDYWWSDAWDPMSYGREFDFNRPFFEQFDELIHEIPHPHSDNTMSENSEYGNFIGYMKSCYLVSASWECEDVSYCSKTRKSSDCVDMLSATRCEECYECVDCESCWNCQYCMSSFECKNSRMLLDCTGCEDCYNCFGLTNQRFYIENIQYSPEEYRKKLEDVENMSWETLQKTNRNGIRKYSVQNKCNNCYGDQLSESENLFHVFDFTRSKDCKYMELGGENCFDSYDAFGVGWHANRTYEVVNTGEYVDSAISTIATLNNSSNIFYSWYIRGSSHLFGCIGLRNASYCILNKQYTKEQYEELVPKIIEHMQKTGEWGEFFPSSLSPFGYNETVAQEYYPMKREEVLGPPFKGGSSPVSGGEQGGMVSETSEKVPPFPPGKGGPESETSLHGPTFNWSDYEPPFPKVEKIIPASKLPDDIKQIPDDILNWAIECEITKKPFRIIKQELEFYRKHNLPIPRRHPDQRHLDRMALRNPRKLFERRCDKCGKEIITTYAPERQERVYCEECYNREVVG